MHLWTVLRSHSDLCIYADSAALYTSWSACSCSLRLPVCLPVTDLCLHGTSGTGNNYEDHWVTGAVELHIWVILSAVYHSVVWLRSNTRLAELIQLHLRHFNLPSTLHLPSDIVYIPRRKYIHRGSRRSYNIDGSCQIRSFRSSKPRSARRLTRTVDPGVLTNLTRSVGNDSGKNNSSFALFNIRSLSTKVPLVYDLPSDRKFDYLGLTETWQKAADFFHLNQSVPPGYSYVCKSRVTGRGGGASNTL